MSKKSPQWRLDPTEVSQYGSGYRASGRKKASQSRALDKSGVQWTLVHLPTGLEVIGEIPQGHYSQKELDKEKSELLSHLFNELEDKVAKHLKIPGRISDK